MKCKYVVGWVSAVTGNRNTSGCADKATAKRDVAALIKEGAKDVQMWPYEPKKVG